MNAINFDKWIYDQTLDSTIIESLRNQRQIE